MSKIIIGADICPTVSNYKLFKEGDRESLIGSELSEILNSVDFTVFNLETPLTDSLSPIIKCGPNLIAPTYTISGIKAINPHFFTLANNHILDQGEKGLLKTMSLLEQNSIGFAGVGRNIKEAKKPYIANVGNYKIGFYCCAEHEFSIANDNKAGANPYDPLYSFDHVRDLKNETDFVVVLYHGGKEHYRYPSPTLQRTFRKFAEVGADLVVAQHTHCIGCMEEYLGATLVYGQGNFLFDNADNEFWRTGMLIEVSLSEEGCAVDFIPIVKNNNIVSVDKDGKSGDSYKSFIERSNRIKTEGVVDDVYNDYAKSCGWMYFSAMSGVIGKSLFGRIINKMLKHKMIYFFYPKKYLPIMENYIECETHRELMIAALKERLN